ncbi:MAG: precorrin-8X methylmutase, partial [Desulfobacterota bacterium]|nr:precorrin-8X methylmutase [Thermodesulfobacteriota bacterium]
AAGISKKATTLWGCQIVCKVSDPDVVRKSLGTGMTRSATALRLAARQLHGGIVAIGNAPTALHEAITLFEKGVLKPALIVGMPVGFVQARESKERLSRCPLPYITNIDRKGGTPATAAALNALILLAEHHAEDIKEYH